MPNIPVDVRADPNEPEPDDLAVAEDDLDERYHWLVAKPDRMVWRQGPSDGLPGTVRVSAKSYEVRVFDPADDEHWGGLYGSIYAADQTIWISSSASPEQQRETLLHEVLHAVEHEAGMSDMEAVVVAWAPILLDALRRNPEVVEFLLQAADTKTGGPKATRSSVDQ